MIDFEKMQRVRSWPPVRSHSQTTFIFVPPMDPVFKVPSVVPQDLLIIQDFIGPVVDNSPKQAPVKASPPSDDTSIESSEDETASEDEVDDLLAPGSPKPCGSFDCSCLCSQSDMLSSLS